MAKDEIRDAILRYSRAVDRCDRELMASVYHPDAIDQHGDLFAGSISSYLDWVFDYLTQRYESTQHVVMNILIEFDPDDESHAQVETYFISHRVMAAASPADRELARTAGRYIDRFERRAGEWRIAHRVTVLDWTDLQPFMEMDSKLSHGSRDRRDPCFQPL